MLSRCDHLLKTKLLRREIRSLGVKLALDRGDQLVMFVLAFSQHLGSVPVALFRFSLGDLRDNLILSDVIPYAHIDGTQPAADGRHCIDDSARFADHLPRDTGGNPPDHTPYRGGDQKNADDEAANQPAGRAIPTS